MTLQGLNRSLEWTGDSRLRLVTIVRLRWLAILGQLAAICVVNFGLDFDLPLGSCLAFIALSAWLNVFLVVRFPARHRLSIGHVVLIALHVRLHELRSHQPDRVAERLDFRAQ